MNRGMTGTLVPMGWVRVLDYLPDNPRAVMATDTECHFVAIFQDGTWFNAHTDEEIDSHVTHWMELPEMPEEGAE